MSEHQDHASWNGELGLYAIDSSIYNRHVGKRIYVDSSVHESLLWSRLGIFLGIRGKRIGHLAIASGKRTPYSAQLSRCDSPELSELI